MLRTAYDQHGYDADCFALELGAVAPDGHPAFLTAEVRVCGNT
jgi:hypothetical protein